MVNIKTKQFFTPIVLLVIFSIITISIFNAYISITTFEQHINNDITKLQDRYLQAHKKEVKTQVTTVLQDIQFQINKVEEFTKEKLNERLETATKVLNFIYSQKKETLSHTQLLNLIAKHFSALTYGKDGYFFIYDYKTNILKFHILPNLIGKDMTNFKDKKGQNIINLYRTKLQNKKIAYAKIYFPKPSDPNHQYEKLVAITKFKPLGIVVGTGIYLDNMTKKVQKLILERFNNKKMSKNGYIFFMKLHNINGGKDFATMILNPNRPDLIGKKLDDNVKDASGKYYRKEYLKVLRQYGKGFVQYYYKKPYMNIQKPKMSYFVLQKKWNWIIASGFYYDDLENEIKNMKHNLKQYSKNIINKTLFWIIFLSILTIIIAIIIASKINQTINFYIKKVEDLNINLYEKTIQLENSMKIITEHVVISKTDLHGKIVEVSDAFCKLSGYTKEELIGKPHNIVRHPDMPKSAFKDLWDTIQQNKTWEGEIKNLRKDGTFYWFIAHISPNFDANGKKIGYMAIRTDITAKKQYEEEHKKLIQAEKLASMGELIGNIAHQWRQPLSLISTSATAIELKHTIGDLTDDDIEKYCKTIENTAQYLSKTINSFRDFIKNDKIKVVFNIKDEIDNFLHIMQATIKSNHINIILDIQDNAEILGYENNLTQCYINILENAKDAFNENDINYRLFFISVIKQDNKVKITFKDNGGGVKEDALNKVFEPYFTTKHQSQGTGLGLHRVYNIITQQFNGDIYIQNVSYTYNDQKYKGAQITITLDL